MVKQIFIFLILLNIFSTVVSQEKLSVHIETWVNYRFLTNQFTPDPGINGAALSVGVQRSISRNWHSGLAAEFGAAGAGNYFAVAAGITREVHAKSTSLVFKPGINLLQGMALFKPDPIYIWGLEQANFFGFRLKNGSAPGVILGVRYYGFPGYAAYSETSSFMDIRAGIRYMF